MRKNFCFLGLRDKKMNAHFAGIFSLILLLLFGCILLTHACVHYADFWSLLVVVPAVIAFFSPAVCYGYNRMDDVFRNAGNMDAETFRSCREMGWAIAGVLLMASYGIPVLAWYNAALGWPGVIEVDMALNCWVWAYLIWLRIFVFY